MLWEAISNTRKSVSSNIRTLRSWLKKNFSMFGYLMKRSFTLPRVWYITSNLRKDHGHGVSICYVSCSNNDFSDAFVSKNLHGIILSASQIPVYIKRKEFDYLRWCQYSFRIPFSELANRSCSHGFPDPKHFVQQFYKENAPRDAQICLWLRSRVSLIRTFEYYSIFILSQYGNKTVLIICDCDRTYEIFYYS